MSWMFGLVVALLLLRVGLVLFLVRGKAGMLMLIEPFGHRLIAGDEPS
jgi:hypothetical protein